MPVTFAYIHSHGLLSSLAHYLVLRGVFDWLREHGVSYGVLILIGLAILLVLRLLFRRRPRGVRRGY